MSTAKDLKKIKVKVPKGTRDFNEKEMALRNLIFEKVKTVFQKHGAVTIDTPVFELKEILSGKYGEDSKLIYDLQDQGGELCSLRYDLTVPFARYCAMNKVDQIKRFQIAKVYRRDNISINKGRMREFYQCDFDIAGSYDLMIPDSQCLTVLVEILESLQVGEFTVKINHRKILDGMFEYCGVPEEKIRSISSAVDKLDKMSWEDVKKEMTNEKGLEESIADKIGEFVGFKGGVELVDTLLSSPLAENAKAKQGIEEMKVLFEYLGCLGIQDRISFDLSLARGLDYYTGVIYEAAFNSTSDETSGVGSIAAGGRYDTLVGMFSNNPVPCVGVSIGIERVYAILSKKENAIRSVTTQVYVSAVDGQIKERLLIAKELWDAGISADFMYKVKPKIRNQLSGCEKAGVPFAVIVGQNEIDQGVVKIKNFATTEEITVQRAEMVEKLQELLKQHQQ